MHSPIKYLLPNGLTCAKKIFKSFSTSSFSRKAFVDKVTVIGGGHMGTGIAQICAAAPLGSVTVADVSENSLSKARTKMKQRLERASKKLWKEQEPEKVKLHVEEVLSRLTFTTDVLASVRNSDLVVEAITEDLQLKHELLRNIDEVAPAPTIFVTNTSSIPVHELAQSLSMKRKENFCGAHFFEPVVMKLVEVAKIKETREDTFHKVMEWARFIGKVPLACKDVPGFIANRLNIPYFIDAINMYERGDASIKDIDTAMKLGAGYPYGPFELADYIGIDVVYMIMQGWEKRFPNNERYKCPKTLVELYQQGRYGKKSGHGFYEHQPE